MTYPTMYERVLTQLSRTAYGFLAQFNTGRPRSRRWAMQRTGEASVGHEVGETHGGGVFCMIVKASCVQLGCGRVVAQRCRKMEDVLVRT